MRPTRRPLLLSWPQLTASLQRAAAATTPWEGLVLTRGVMVFEMWVMALFILPIISGQCPTETLVVYKLELETFWDEDIFPKQYPQWRPSAQWSKTVGELFSFNSHFTPP